MVVENGFLTLDEDHYVCTKRFRSNFIFMTIYMDDILIDKNSLKFLTQAETWLSSIFYI